MRSTILRNLARGLLGAVACLGLAGALFARDAEAGTANVIAGNACLIFPTSAGKCSPAGASLINTTTNHCLVACPLARRNLGNTNGLAGLWVTGTGLACTAEARSFLNESWDSEFKEGNGILAFTGINTSPINGVYSLLCTVLPGGQLMSIRWDEF